MARPRWPRSESGSGGSRHKRHARLTTASRPRLGRFVEGGPAVSVLESLGPDAASGRALHVSDVVAHRGKDSRSGAAFAVNEAGRDAPPCCARCCDHPLRCCCPAWYMTAVTMGGVAARRGRRKKGGGTPPTPPRMGCAPATLLSSLTEFAAVTYWCRLRATTLAAFSLTLRSWSAEGAAHCRGSNGGSPHSPLP